MDDISTLVDLSLSIYIYSNLIASYPHKQTLPIQEKQIHPTNQNKQMAEFLVPKIIDQLSDVALKQLGERVNLVMGVEEEVGNLSSKFSTIKDVLRDAERRRLKEENVGVWLEKLEGITYEMDDVLDEWNIKIHKPKNNLDQGSQNVRRMPTLFDKVCSFIPSLCSCLKQVSVRSDIALKIKDINDKLELALKEANQFNFVTSRSGRFFDSNEFKRPMTTSVFDESEMHGRKSDKDSLLKHLMPESSSKEVGKDGIKVISIVGVGGSGKTTLAQMLYNDDRVKNDFQLRKWVCVSDPFDEKRIASALLEGSETSDPNLRELESLFQRVKESFSRKKFLLVLDDVWTEDSSKWKPFRDCLKDGGSGSIIIVTTRNERVARAVGTNYQHPLGLISNSDCWLILKRVALSERSELCERVEKIGWKIAEKCKGLPLAAKTMGGLLQFKDTVQEWQEVLDSKIWQMEEASMNLFPHFYLSYNELSPQLKRCFSYCAVFPKDHEINVEQLIRLWMAQGYLGTSRGGDERMEMKGLEYFKNLAMRSFFQELEIDVNEESKIVNCKMHDIVHDFAQFLTKNECCIIDKVDYERVNGENSSKVRARHVTLWLGTIGTLISSLVFDTGRLRSLFMVDFDGELPKDLFSSLKCVRALNLTRVGLKEVPREVGNLIHLRYLNLSWNRNLEELPEAICKLYYLETLDIRVCKNLSCLPQRIGELAHLRHLRNYGTVKSQENMPQGFGKLTSLRTLGEFNVGGSYGDIVLLKYLNQLEELAITVHGKVDFGNAQLGKKIYIQKFGLEFVGDDMENSSWTEVMELEPPPNLKWLELKGYQGPQLPKWIVCESLINNLKSLRLRSPKNISSLPCLWKLSSLEYLFLRDIQSLKHLGCEFFGLPKKNVDDDDDNVEAVAFPSLKRLEFESLLNWETWEDLISSEDDEGDEEKTNAATISVMPRLQELRIWECRTLKVLPHRILGKTSKLKLLKFNFCNILKERYSDKTGEEWMKISHIPQVVIW